MKEQEYKTEKEAIESDFLAKQKELQDSKDRQVLKLKHKYAKFTQTHNVGDVFESESGICILIESITIYTFQIANDLPCCNYNGVILGKNMKPNKKGVKASFTQNQLKK